MFVTIFYKRKPSEYWTPEEKIKGLDKALDEYMEMPEKNQ